MGSPDPTELNQQRKGDEGLPTLVHHLKLMSIDCEKKIRERSSRLVLLTRRRLTSLNLTQDGSLIFLLMKTHLFILVCLI